MIVYLVTAVALVAVGAVIGVIWVVSLGIRREEAAASMTTVAPDRSARAARVLTGLYVRTPGVTGRPVLTREDSRA
jgi:hypothetical protein